MHNYKILSKQTNTENLQLILIGLFSFLFLCFGIWTAVEFILYLVKDQPFNWLSIWFAGGALVIELFLFFRLIIKN